MVQLAGEIYLIIQGTIVKGIAGFYYVDDGKQVYECRARGVFKNVNTRLSVGDEADVDISGDTPVIVRIHERSNLFLRPPVANIEQFILVSAMSSPKPNLFVIDKFLTAAESSDVDIVMCFTKRDMTDEKAVDWIRGIYGDIYPTVFMDARSGEEVRCLVSYLKGRKSALAGPSGVGKSTIINALRRGTDIKTGAVSGKTNRGRHTTRHVELFRCDFGGMVFDTPGFTSFDVPEVEEYELQFLFPDIAEYAGRCRFNGCRHMSEPDCAVRGAVEAGRIHRTRYESYRSQIEQIREKEKNRY